MQRSETELQKLGGLGVTVVVCSQDEGAPSEANEGTMTATHTHTHRERERKIEKACRQAISAQKDETERAHARRMPV